MGQLQDGYNSVMRYIKNNFFDGDRQDSFDILTGAWIAKRGGIPPLTDTRPLLMRAVSHWFRWISVHELIVADAIYPGFRAEYDILRSYFAPDFWYVNFKSYAKE